jgi:hypothetical protein
LCKAQSSGADPASTVFSVEKIVNSAPSLNKHKRELLLLDSVREGQSFLRCLGNRGASFFMINQHLSAEEADLSTVLRKTSHELAAFCKDPELRSQRNTFLCNKYFGQGQNCVAPALSVYTHSPGAGISYWFNVVGRGSVVALEMDEATQSLRLCIGGTIIGKVYHTPSKCAEIWDDKLLTWQTVDVPVECWPIITNEIRVPHQVLKEHHGLSVSGSYSANLHEQQLGLIVIWWGCCVFLVCIPAASAAQYEEKVDLAEVHRAMIDNTILPSNCVAAILFPEPVLYATVHEGRYLGALLTTRTASFEIQATIEKLKSSYVCRRTVDSTPLDLCMGHDAPADVFIAPEPEVMENPIPFRNYGVNCMLEDDEELPALIDDCASECDGLCTAYEDLSCCAHSHDFELPPEEHRQLIAEG